MNKIFIEQAKIDENKIYLSTIDYWGPVISKFKIMLIGNNGVSIVLNKPKAIRFDDKNIGMLFDFMGQPEEMFLNKLPLEFHEIKDENLIRLYKDKTSLIKLASSIPIKC